MNGAASAIVNVATTNLWDKPSWLVLCASHEGSRHRFPGTVLEVTADTIRVATPDGELAILELQPEGKRAMRVHDFVPGHKVVAGDVFSQA